MVAYANGGGTAPLPHDILCYNKKSGTLPSGHVAIIKAVNSGSVEVIEQNWTCASCTRTISMTVSNGKYTVSTSANYPIQGWLREPNPFSPATASWTSTPASGWYRTDQRLTYTYSGSDVQVSEDPTDGILGEMWVSQGGPVTELRDYSVHVQNGCGNVTIHWQGGWDPNAPTISVTAPQPSHPYNTAQSVAWNVGDAGSGFAWVQTQWDSNTPGQFIYASGSQSVPDDSLPHTFKIRASDNVGNVSPWYTYGPFIVDMEAPNITFLGPQQKAWLNSPGQIIWAISGAVGATLQWDGGDHVQIPLGSGDTVDEGIHTAALTAVDWAQNTATAGGEYWIDLHAPVYAPGSLMVPAGSGCLDTLSAAWAFTDDVAGVNAVSGVAQYEYWIGSTPGASDVFGPRSTDQSWAWATNLQLSEGSSYYVTVRAQDAAGNWSNAVTSSGILASIGPSVWGPIMDSGGTSVDARSSANYTLVDSLGQFVSGESFSETGSAQHGYWQSDIEYVQAANAGAAKSVADGETVQIGNADKPLVVTAAPGVFADRFYVEQPDKSSGIAAQYGPDGGRTLIEGDRVWLTGKAGDIAGERGLLSATAYYVDHIDPLGSLAIPGARIGGGPFGLQEGIVDASGLNNIGLLVRTWGKVTDIEPVETPALPTWFTINDGNGVNLKCALPEGVNAPGLNAFVQVTGISSCEKAGDELRRLLRVRTRDDIAVL